MLRSLAFPILILATALSALAAPRLKVSGNKRFLLTDDGKPFFWLGDTAWELFHRLNRDEADHYLRTRAEQGSPSSRRWSSLNWMGWGRRTQMATGR